MRERTVSTVTFLMAAMIFVSLSFLPDELIAQNNTKIPRQVMKLSLDEAITLALSQNPDVRKSRARIDGAKASLQKADSVFYPYLGASVGYTKADAPSVFLFKTIDQREFINGTDFNDPGEVENYETALMGQLNLFRGGSDYLNRKIAEKGVEASVSGKKTVENRLVASVIQSYYDYLSAKEYVVISEESVKTVQSQLKIMNIRFRGGGALKSDILSLKVRLAQAREDLVRSRNRLKITIAGIARLLGLIPDTNVQFTNIGSVNISIPIEYSDGLNDALKKRPELEHMKLQVKQSEMGIKAAKASWYPRVDLSGKYYYDDPEMSYGDDENWVVSVDVNMDLFTGFARGAAKKRG
jgi:outer membrane protein TolC